MSETKVAVHDKFEFTVVDSDTGNVRCKASAYNIVLDNYFRMMLGYSSVGGGSTASDRIIRFLKLGTGDLTNIDPTDTTRTALVSGLASKSVTLESVNLEADGLNVAKYTATFTETEANGTITEVALGVSSSTTASDTTCVTWAPITDSEGHPTSITKTNSDILHVTATIYSKIQLESGSPIRIARKVFPGNYTYSSSSVIWGGSLNYDDQSAQLDSDYPRESGSIIRTTLGATNLAVPAVGSTNAAIRIGYTTNPLIWSISTHMTDTSDSIFNLSSRNSWNTEVGQDGSIRVSTSQILSSSSNIAKLPLIKSLMFAGGFWIPFPNHSVFPPTTLTLDAVGDGTTSGFNLGVPELMTDGVSVTVDGVTVPASSYTWYGRDYSYGQAYKSYDTRYLAAIPDGGPVSDGQAEYAIPFPPGYLQNVSQAFLTDGSDKSYFYWDFGENYTVSQIFREGAERNTGSGTVTVSLEYSNNNRDWTVLIGDSYSVRQPTVTLTAANPVSARYWRLLAYYQDHRPVPTVAVYTSSGGGVDHIGTWLAFGDPKPTIQFNSPPAAGSKIIVKAKCEYPIKNTNWSIDASTFDMNIVRGS